MSPRPPTSTAEGRSAARALVQRQARLRRIALGVLRLLFVIAIFFGAIAALSGRFP